MELFTRFLLLFCRFFFYWLTPIVKLFYKKHQKLPVIVEDKDCVTNGGINEDTQNLLMKPVRKNLLLIPASDLVIEIKSGKVRKLSKII